MSDSHRHLSPGVDDPTDPAYAAAIKLGEAVVRNPQSVSSEFVTEWQNGHMTATEALDGILANFGPDTNVRRPDVSDWHFWTDFAKLAAALGLQTKGDPLAMAASVLELTTKLLNLLDARDLGHGQ